MSFRKDSRWSTFCVFSCTAILKVHSKRSLPYSCSGESLSSLDVRLCHGDRV